MENNWTLDFQCCKAVAIRISISIVPVSSGFPRGSFGGLLSYWSPFVFLDRWYPCFRNFDSVIPVDVNRVKSYADNFLVFSGVYQYESRSITFSSFQSGRWPVLLACQETAEVWVQAKRISLSCLMKTRSKQLKRRDLHFKWLHPGTND